jgi:NTE family protein
MRTTVGISLGSGSDRGFAHIGILKALLRFGIPINEITGSSMGALLDQGKHFDWRSRGRAKHR